MCQTKILGLAALNIFSFPGPEEEVARPNHGLRRMKVYSTPQEAVQDMVPPGCKFVLNHGDHRFTTNWVGPTKKIPAELMNKSFSRSFVTKDWRDALAEVHMRMWLKWEFQKNELPLPAGTVPQEPGVVPDEVLEGLKPFIDKLPQVRKQQQISQ